MRFDPNAPDGGVLAEGIYEARTSAKQETSKAGNAMLTVTANVFSCEDVSETKDYWTSKNKKNMASFCRATGQYDDVFMRGEVTPEHVNGRRVRVRLVVEDKGKINPTTGNPYPPKNVITEYLPTELTQEEPLRDTSGDVPPEEDVPF